MEYMQSEVSLDASAMLLSALSIVSNGGNKYYEKVCENCSTQDPTPIPENSAYASTFLYTFSEMDYLQL